MLVISRRIGESFFIGDDIEATIVDITGDKVVLGIRAPRTVPITRTEIAGQIAQSNRQAGQGAGNMNPGSFANLYKARFPGKGQ